MRLPQRFFRFGKRILKKKESKIILSYLGDFSLKR
jgi:hypothetical protein